MDFSKTVKPKHQYKYGAKGQTFSIRPSPPSTPSLSQLELLIEYKNRGERERRKGEEGGRKKQGERGGCQVRGEINKHSEASGSAAPGMRLHCSPSGGAPLREAPMALD
jgi:hypothetical protein